MGESARQLSFVGATKSVLLSQQQSIAHSFATERTVIVIEGLLAYTRAAGVSAHHPIFPFCLEKETVCTGFQCQLSQSGPFCYSAEDPQGRHYLSGQSSYQKGSQGEPHYRGLSSLHSSAGYYCPMFKSASMEGWLED